MTQHAPFVILGGGLTGLAAGSALGAEAVVLERDATPGGLVKTLNLGGYWFDQVLHLLHFPSWATEVRALVESLIGPMLARCPPQAVVHCASGTARYPMQVHLSDLPPAARVACVRDFARATLVQAEAVSTNYKDLLLAAFGRSMCDEFFFPYNEKQWRRPLDALAPSGFQWNLHRPALDEVIAGALGGGAVSTDLYNSDGFYPRPDPGSMTRGMQTLSEALAAQVVDLRLEHEVEAIDLERRVVVASNGTERRHFSYDRCLCTLPLPAAIRMCANAPSDLVRCVEEELRWNRVRSVMFGLRSARPNDGVLWRYFTDPALPFTRLYFMTEFDPLSAPENGWSVVAEVLERSEDEPEDASALAARVLAGMRLAGAVPASAEVIVQHVETIDPAYVVFTPSNHDVMRRARRFLETGQVAPLGRYGHWEYSSMCGAMNAGLQWAHGVRPARAYDHHLL